MAFVGTRRALLSSTAKKPAASWNFAGQGQLPSWLSFSRASNATNFNSSGNLVYAPNNGIRNNSMAGAVAGTARAVGSNISISRTASTTAVAVMASHNFSVGDLVTISGATGTNASEYNGTFRVSAVVAATSFSYVTSTSRTDSVTGASISGLSQGTIPTNWVLNASNGLTNIVVGTGTSNGITYIDLRLAGLASSTFFVESFDDTSTITASSGQFWAESLFAAVVAGSTTNTSNIRTSIRQQGGAGTLFEANMSLSATLTRQPVAVGTLTASATAIQPSFALTLTNGAMIDLTLRIGLPQASLVTGAQTDIIDMPSTSSAAYYGPRFDYDPSTLAAKGLLLEGARTNSIRNNTMVGAVAGTPGTMPTNWSTFTGVTGLTRTIVGTGTENGISYIDIQISGTPGSSGSYSIIFESATAMAALTGQFWNFSTYIKLAGGALTNVGTPGLSAQENTSGGSFVAGGTSVVSFTPTSSGLATQRYSGNRTLSGGGTVAAVQDYLTFGVTSGQAINVTLRIGLPQAELLSSSTQTASSPIPTTGSALTRSADIAIITGVPATILASSQGTALVETTQAANYVGANARLIGADVRFVIGTGSPSGNLINFSSDNTLLSTSNPTWTSTARGAIGWSASGRTLVATGVASVSDAKPLATNASFWLGSQSGASNTYADGWYSRAAFWSSRLPDAVLSAKVVLGAPL